MLLPKMIFSVEVFTYSEIRQEERRIKQETRRKKQEARSKKKEERSSLMQLARHLSFLHKANLIFKDTWWKMRPVSQKIATPWQLI